MADMLSESETVESGCPLRTHGSGFLGEIEIPCDGTIAGQIWGAGIVRLWICFSLLSTELVLIVLQAVHLARSCSMPSTQSLTCRRSP